MRTIKAEPLSAEAFLPFGFYANLINPTAAKLGAAPIEFFRDMVQQDLGGASIVSFSTCRVEQRPLVIDACEYHSALAEGLLPLDHDVLVHVAPASADGQVPLDAMRVFAVPRGTMVVLRPGVWHHAAFTVNSTEANLLIALPQRAYANDCIGVELGAADQIRIEV